MIKTDQHNYRKHSDKNKRIINKSLKKLGAGRSILIDSEDEIIAGNGVFEQAGKLGIPVKVIETDGKELIAVKRTDLKTGDKQRKELALIDNHASDTSEFDMEAIEENFTAEDLQDWGFEIEKEKDPPEQTDELRGFSRSHILISYHPDHHEEVVNIIESLSLIDGIEIETGSNG